MCTAHYTEEVLLICEWETDKQSCPKYRREFGWWGVLGEENENQVAGRSEITQFHFETHSWDLKPPYCAIFTFDEFNLKMRGGALEQPFYFFHLFQACRRYNTAGSWKLEAKTFTELYTVDI